MQPSHKKLALRFAIITIFVIGFMAHGVTATATSCGNNITTSGDYELTGNTTAAGNCRCSRKK